MEQRPEGSGIPAIDEGAETVRAAAEPASPQAGRWAGLAARVSKSGPGRALAGADAFVRGHVWLVIALCGLTMLVAAFLKFRIYPPEQFLDANGILNAVADGGNRRWNKSFMLVIDFFLVLSRVTGNLSLETWGYVLLLPGFAVLAFLVKKAPPQNLASALLLLLFSVLLPFFVLTTSKDMLQYLIFFLVALALLYVPRELFKLCAACLLLVPVCILFRSYYVLMIGFSAALFVVALLYRRPKTVRHQALFLVTLACAAVAAFSVLHLIVPESADTLFTVRTVTNLNAGVTPAGDKVLWDVLPLDRSVPGFLVNYLVAALRMLFPFELCADLGDLPFVVFQLLLVALLLTGLVRSRRVQARTAVYAVVIAFFLMSFFFEPDFGSWFRHEAAAFPILWLGVGGDRKTILREAAHGASS